jgi:hypothetical protein
MLLHDVLYEQELVVKGISDSKSANQFISRIEKIDDRGEAQVLVREKLRELEKRLKNTDSESPKAKDLQDAIDVLKAWTDKNPLGKVTNPAKFAHGATGGPHSAQGHYGRGDPAA